MIDLNPNHLKTVKQSLAEHVPACEVRAFGSRVTQSAKKYSDLHIQVDVLDWQEISQSFKDVIANDYAVLQKMPAGADGSVARNSEQSSRR